MKLNENIIKKYTNLVKNTIDRLPVVNNVNYIKDLFENYKNNHEYKLFQIKNNQLYCVSNQSISGEIRLEGSKAHLLKILKNYNLPDMEFILFDGDSLNTEEPIIVSTSCQKNNNQLLVPDWMFQFSPNSNLFDYKKDMESIYAAAHENGTTLESWKKRINKIFYRGSLNNNYRGAYANLNNDSIFDIKHVPLLNVPTGQPNYIIGVSSNACSREYKAKFKYQLHLNGHEDSAYSTALRFGLACCSLMLYGTNNPYKEWWIDDSIFDINKLCVIVSSPQQLLEAYNYYENNQEEAYIIAHNGFNFVQKYLSIDHVQYYYYNLLLEYSKKFNYDITLHSDAQLITTYENKYENNK